MTLDAGDPSQLNLHLRGMKQKYTGHYYTARHVKRQSKNPKELPWPVKRGTL